MKKIFFSLILVLFLGQTEGAVASTKTLKNKENVKACSNFKSKYSVSILESWSKGESSDKQLLEEIELNINNLLKYNKKTTKNLKLSISKIINSENILKKSIEDQDLDNILSSFSLKIDAIKQTQKICDSIL